MLKFANQSFNGFVKTLTPGISGMKLGGLTKQLKKFDFKSAGELLSNAVLGNGKSVTLSLVQAQNGLKNGLSTEGSSLLQRCQQFSKKMLPVKSAVKHAVGETTPKVVNTMKKSLVKANQHLDVLSTQFARQCNALAAYRIRRFGQILSMYKELGYDRHMLIRLARQFLKREGFPDCKKPLRFLLGAAMFSWNDQRISDDEIKRFGHEIFHFRRNDEGSIVSSTVDGWECVIEKKDLKAWRRSVDDTYLYEYKMYGTFHDIPARAFYNAQTDMKYRRQWDKLIIKLDTVEREKNSGNEVVQWIMHFPYPMYSREYVYVRKRFVDEENKLLVLMSRATDHPACPKDDQKYVRVDTYQSYMVIKPHKSFDENGFDFVITYHDDPKSAFPKVAQSWMASTGVPDFVDKMHKAAKTMYEWKQQGKWRYEDEEEDSEQNHM